MAKTPAPALNIRLSVDVFQHAPPGTVATILIDVEHGCWCLLGGELGPTTTSVSLMQVEPERFVMQRAEKR